MVLLLPKCAAHVQFPHLLLELIGGPDDEEDGVAVLPELPKLYGLALTQPIDIRYEIAEECLLVGERVNVLYCCEDVLNGDSFVAVAVEPIEYEPKDGLVAHEAEGGNASDVVFEEYLSRSLARNEGEEALEIGELSKIRIAMM